MAFWLLESHTAAIQRIWIRRHLSIERHFVGKTPAQALDDRQFRLPQLATNFHYGRPANTWMGKLRNQVRQTWTEAVEPYRLLFYSILLTCIVAASILLPGATTIKPVIPGVAAASSGPLLALLGAVIGAAIASAVAWLNTRHATAADQRLAQAARDEARRLGITERVSTFMAATYHAVLSLKAVALAEAHDKQHVNRAEFWAAVDRVNMALVAIRINDAEDLVQSVEAIDSALILLSREARDRTFTQAEWRIRRTEIMGRKPEDATETARMHTFPS